MGCLRIAWDFMLEVLLQANGLAAHLAGSLCTAEEALRS
jgi:hypothetical protein